MKIYIAALILVSTVALAEEPTKVAACSGHHHGSYVNIVQSTKTGSVLVKLSTDADEDESPTRTFVVKSIKKSGENVARADFAKVIQKSIVEEFGSEGQGTALVRASGKKGSILLNFGAWGGKNFLVDEKGYIEEITCRE